MIFICIQVMLGWLCLNSQKRNFKCLTLSAVPGQLAVLSAPSLSLASSSTITQLSIPIIQAAERHFT